MGTEHKRTISVTQGVRRPVNGESSGVPQIDRFRQMARELGCDEDEEAFRAKLRTIARQKVKEEPVRRGLKTDD